MWWSLLAVGCPRPAPVPAAPIPVGRYAKRMDDSGLASWFEVVAVAGAPVVRRWEQVDLEVADEDAASRADTWAIGGATATGWWSPFDCEGPEGEVRGRVALAARGADLGVELVSPPEVGADWSCHGDFDVVFGLYARR